MLIFLEAVGTDAHPAFSETRLPHPLSPALGDRGIREERAAMRAIRKLADHVVDTSR